MIKQFKSFKKAQGCYFRYLRIEKILNKVFNRRKEDVRFTESYNEDLNSLIYRVSNEI